MNCPSKNSDCEFVDTSGMTKTKECYQCEHYKEPDQSYVQLTGATPVLASIIEYVDDLRKRFNDWRKSLKSKYQVVRWDQRHRIRYIKGNPLKDPAAFHLIYKWSFWIGKTEIRKFLNEKEMYRAIQIYINRPL